MCNQDVFLYNIRTVLQYSLDEKKKLSTEVLYIPLPEHYLMFSIFVKYIDHLEKIYKRIPVKIPKFFIQLPASFFLVIIYCHLYLCPLI